jgi:hypothetical protein
MRCSIYADLWQYTFNASYTHNKLVVTSSETVAVGDEVIVKGLVKTNVDIGAGYNYKVLLEEAGFSR